MRDICYLVIESNGVTGLTKRPPQLRSGQHAVKLSVSVADKYFERAIPTAELNITDKHVISPVIDVALSEAP